MDVHKDKKSDADDYVFCDPIYRKCPKTGNPTEPESKLMAAMSYSGVWGMGSGSSWVQGLFWSQEDIWGLGRGGGCTAL